MYHCNGDTLYSVGDVVSSDKTLTITKTGDPDFIIELDNATKVKVASAQELTTVCKAYQMAKLGYKVYGRIL